MSLLWRLLRAEYHWQPGQLPRRAWRKLSGVTRQNCVTIQLPWGHPIRVNPQEIIGSSITALNVLDLPVTEAIWRLLEEGETAADIGANIGYMSSVMAARLRRGGRILAFEPMPALADELRRNALAWQSLTAATIEVHELALSDCSGPATLHVPPDYAINHGLASLHHPTAPGAPGSKIEIQCARLDDVVPAPGRVALIKADVEGNELQVFAGATRLLDERRVRDIIFEEQQPYPAASSLFLESKGFTLFRVTRGLLGPLLRPPGAPNPREIDSPTFLATLDAQRARLRFAARGWFTFTRT